MQLSSVLAVLVALAAVSVARAQTPAPAGALVPAPITVEQARRAGPGHPWQARVPGVNLDSRAKLTDVPLFSFRDVGGLPFALALHHSSQAVYHDPAVGPKWSHGFDTHVDVWRAGSRQRAALVCGNHRVQLWQRNGPQWTPLDGYRDTLVLSGTTLTVSRADGTMLEFEYRRLAGKLRYALARIADKNGNALVCGYANHRLASVIAPSGRTCYFVYDSEGRLIRIDLVSGSFARSWDVLRGSGGAFQGVRMPEVTVGGVPSFFDVFVTVDLQQNVTSFTDRSGATLESTYDSGQPGELASLRMPGNSALQVLDEPASGATRLTDERSVATTWVHDARGRWNSRTLGGGATAGVLTRAYDDPDFGWRASLVANTAGNAWTFDYDAGGRLVGATSPLGGRFDYAYDGAGRLAQILEPLVTDAWGVVEPARHRVDFQYDFRGNVVVVQSYTSASSHADTLYAYDGLGRLVQRTDANGATAEFTYDGYGNCVSLTTPAGRTLQWLFEDAEATFGYSVPDAFVDGLGRRCDFTRDEWGRRLAETYPGGSVTYAYDAMDRLVQMNDATGTTDFAYDARGLRTDEIRGATSLHWSYLQNGLRSSMALVAPGVVRNVDYAYTGKNELAQVIDDGLVTALLWDRDCRLIRRTLANGVRMEKSYAGGMLASTSHFSPTNVPLASYTHAYQANLRLASVAESGGALTRYGYDFPGRLGREERTGPNAYQHTFGYDAAGRRVLSTDGGLPTSIALDDDGLPVLVVPPAPEPPQIYAWDANGRLAQFDRAGAQHRLQWDFAGRLAAAEAWNGFAWLPSRTYAYDGFDRRVQATSFDTNGVPLSLSTFTYDGTHVALEDRQDFAGPDFRFRASWAQGLAGYRDPLAGVAYYPLVDGSGSLRGVTGASGTSNGYAGLFDAFGAAIQDQGQRPPFAQCAECGVFTDLDGLLGAVSSAAYDTLLGRDLGWTLDSIQVDPFPVPAPTGVFLEPFELIPLEILPLELISIPVGSITFTAEDVIDLIDSFSSITDPMEHGTNGAAFLADVVINGPAAASDKALAGEYGGVIQGAATLGHLAAGETDKILEAAEHNALGKLGIALGEGAVGLYWWLSDCLK